MSVVVAATRMRKPSYKQTMVQEFLEVREELVGTLAAFLGNADDAQDVAQEAFLKCWRDDGEFQNIRNWRAWLFRVGMNAAKDLQRNAFRRRARPLNEAPTKLNLSAGSPAEAVMEDEDQERLCDALHQLRPEEKEVFQLRQNSGLTYEEIADRTGRPTGTIKTQMRTALLKLRSVLSET